MSCVVGMSAFVHAAAVAVGLLIYVIMTHVGRQRRHPSAAIAWVLALVTFPYASIPLFLLLGTRKLTRMQRPPFAAFGPDASLAPAWAVRLSAGLSLPQPCSNRRITLLDDGHAALDALVELIDTAQHRVDLCAYVVADDEVGRRVATALALSARGGVRVRVLVDAVGSLRAPRALRRMLLDAGVEMRHFMPLLHNPTRGRTNLRNHRKLAIADTERVWSGGRNIAVEYFMDRPGNPAWRDLSFLVEGPLASDATSVFERDWRLAGGRPSVDDERSVATGMLGTGPAQLIASGPDYADDTIYTYLLTAVYQAQTSIVAATPYFVPDDALLQALVVACRRGVRVTLLMPECSNHHLADWARARAFRELARAGAIICLSPQMLHAKLLIVDDTIALCGSVNLDGRSLFLNYELTTAFYGQAEIDGFARWFVEQSSQALRYSPREPSWVRDLAEGIVRAVAFQL